MLLNRIKERGKEFDMSLQDIAEATHISPNTIYSWRVKNPRTDKLKQVAKVLHTTTDYLNGLTDDPSIPNNNENHINSNTLTWLDLDMPYGGTVPDELKDYYKAMAEQYIKQHPEILKKRDDK